MLTLGIETSCDETSCAVLQDHDKLLSNIISSSLFRHKPFGGVVPEIASRHSLEQIDTVLQEALSEAKVSLKDIDLVAVTYGPGLIGSLFVGVSFAKALSYGLGVPLIGVNHLEAHLAANFIGQAEPERFIGLLVSGGHTSLTFHEHGKAQLVGETVDDAVGEAFDKVAKMLGLGYPGGPVIEKRAHDGNPNRFTFTKPKQDKRFDFSFSGVKTAVRYLLEEMVSKQPESAVKRKDVFEVPEQTVNDLCASFQQTAVSWLVQKTIDAAEDRSAEAIVVGGGVSANSYLRETLTAAGAAKNIKVYFPPKILSLDNAGMIARRGWELFKQGVRSDLNLTGVPSLPIHS